MNQEVYAREVGTSYVYDLSSLYFLCGILVPGITCNWSESLQESSNIKRDQAPEHDS